MKTQAGVILPLAIIGILVISIAPSAFASTLTVTLNPKTKLAEVNVYSHTDIVLTYPNGSQMSQALKGVNTSLSLKGSFVQGDEGVYLLQSSLHEDDHEGNPSIQNMSVSFSYDAKGNATTLVIHKSTNITAWVTGVFSVVNGSVKADLKWRSFVVHSAFNLNFGDRTEDINYVGPATEDSLGDHPIAAGFLLNLFGGSGIWDRPTLNYSQLNSPLSTWTKHYDSGTNTTTFSKTINGNSTFTSSADINGQKYTFSAISDPSAVMAVQGYASASSDSLTFSAAPPAISPLLLIAAAAGTVAVIGIAYLALRARATRSRPLSVPTPSVSK